MNKKEAQDRIESLAREQSEYNRKIGQELEKCLAIIDAPESGWFVPEESDDEFYYLMSDGVYGERLGNCTKAFKGDVFSRQKVFRTESEAKREDDKRKATIKYLKEIARLNDGEKVDWNSESQKKYVAYYGYATCSICFEWSIGLKYKDSDWYSLSESAAKEAASILSQEEQDLIFRS